MLVYQGDSIFAYLREYQFTIRSGHSFTAGEGKLTTVKVIAYEKGNVFTTEFTERPAIEFKQTVVATSPSAAGAAKE